MSISCLHTKVCLNLSIKKKKNLQEYDLLLETEIEYVMLLYSKNNFSCLHMFCD